MFRDRFWITLVLSVPTLIWSEMVEHLSRGPATVKQLAEPARMRLPSAVKHLKVLENGGIVISRKSGRTRTYSMKPGAFGAINAWVREREAAINAAFDTVMRERRAMMPAE